MTPDCAPLPYSPRRINRLQEQFPSGSVHPLRWVGKDILAHAFWAELEILPALPHQLQPTSTVQLANSEHSQDNYKQT